MIDVTYVKQNSDLPSLAGTLTTLTRESAKEYSGSCPKCGGDDRFRVQSDRWACRQCSPRWGDAINLMQFAHDVDFKTAAAMLGDENFSSPVKQSQPIASSKATKPKPFDAGFWRPKIESAQSRLFDETDTAQAARDYLAGRGLTIDTWKAYRLGYDKLSVGNRGEFAPAITLPWIVADELIGFSVRYIDKQHKAKIGNFNGRLYGGWLLSDHYRTCVIVEGEINAMSIYQVAGQTELDVLSLGSESARLSPMAVDRIAKYDHVICWADEQSTAERWASHFNGQYFKRGYAFSTGKQDANELLQAGKLGGVLSALRLRIARQTRSENLLDADLQRGADSLLGLDDDTVAMLESLE